jgi:hypothetical protein
MDMKIMFKFGFGHHQQPKCFYSEWWPFWDLLRVYGSFSKLERFVFHLIMHPNTHFWVKRHITHKTGAWLHSWKGLKFENWGRSQIDRGWAECGCRGQGPWGWVMPRGGDTFAYLYAEPKVLENYPSLEVNLTSSVDKVYRAVSTAFISILFIKAHA